MTTEGLERQLRNKIEILEHRLKEALRCMKEAKRLHFSNTTNSVADDLIERIEAMFPPNA